MLELLLFEDLGALAFDLLVCPVIEIFEINFQTLDFLFQRGTLLVGLNILCFYFVQAFLQLDLLLLLQKQPLSVQVLNLSVFVFDLYFFEPFQLVEVLF